MREMYIHLLTNKGKIIFGVSIGVLCIIIRMWGGLPEGVTYPILLMNGMVPLIDRFTMQKKFGFVKVKKDGAK